MLRESLAAILGHSFLTEPKNLLDNGRKRHSHVPLLYRGTGSCQGFILLCITSIAVLWSQLRLSARNHSLDRHRPHDELNSVLCASNKQSDCPYTANQNRLVYIALDGSIAILHQWISLDLNG